MAGANEDQTTLENYGGKIEQPLEGLTKAIGALRSACERLKTSVDGVNVDLENTNRRMADALKIHSETAAYLEEVLAGLPVGVIVVDADGRIVLFNPAAEDITGFMSQDITGHMYSEVLGKNVSHKQTPLYTLATGSPIGQEEKTLTSASGQRIPVSSSTSLIGTGKTTVGAIEVLVDLRRLKALEEEVDRIRTLAAMGELAAVVAHEVRNPLGGIKGFASLLERDLETDPEKLALVRKIRDGVECMEGVVEDLLEAGRDARPNFARTELIGDIQKVVEMSEMAARGEGKNLEFKLSTPRPPVYCRVDAARIRQALANLIRNAVEASGETGWVEVNLRTSGEVPAGEKRPRNYISIEVTDAGGGIHESLTDKIFTPFFTTKHKGTGLGLHTVKRIAGLHGGKVEYASAESGGSTFTLTVPRW